MNCPKCRIFLRHGGYYLTVNYILKQQGLDPIDKNNRAKIRICPACQYVWIDYQQDLLEQYHRILYPVLPAGPMDHLIAAVDRFIKTGIGAFARSVVDVQYELNSRAIAEHYGLALGDLICTKKARSIFKLPADCDFNLRFAGLIAEGRFNRARFYRGERYIEKSVGFRSVFTFDWDRRQLAIHFRTAERFWLDPGSAWLRLGQIVRKRDKRIDPFLIMLDLKLRNIRPMDARESWNDSEAESENDPDMSGPAKKALNLMNDRVS